MLNDEEDRLLAVFESNAQHKSYLKYIIQNNRFEFNLSPSVSALENSENKDAKILGDCSIKNFNCIDHPNNPEDWSVQTSRELLQRLNKQYDTIDLTHDAALKFDDLFQCANPFQGFLAVFISLSIKSKKSEAQKVDAIKTKVSSEIVLALKNVASPPSRDDFAASSDLCQILYNNYQEFEHIQRNKAMANQNYVSKSQQILQIKSTASKSEEELGQSESTKEAYHQKCFQKGLCYYYKGFSHLAQDCHSKKAADLRNINQDCNANYHPGFASFSEAKNSRDVLFNAPVKKQGKT
ncbi:hypothetical protein K3495_g9803 [Podosphaera aphanis]|nr:hypothetical protein K3495_g9803 [Podosphaera aphanis]